MNKQNLVDFVAEKASVSKKVAEEAINAVFKGIVSGLQSDQEARFIGFGSFTVQKIAARKGRHPKTGEEITIAASNRISFRPGKELKEAVNS